MPEHRRPDDHLVEPLFAALDHSDHARAKRRGRGRRLWILILTLAAIAAAWFVTVGA